MLKTCSELWVCRDHRFSCLHSLTFFFWSAVVCLTCRQASAEKNHVHTTEAVVETSPSIISKLQKNTQIPPPSNIFQKLESLEKVRNTESINYINSGCPSYIHSQLYVKYSAHINSVLGSNFCKCNLY